MGVVALWNRPTAPGKTGYTLLSCCTRKRGGYKMGALKTLPPVGSWKSCAQPHVRQGEEPFPSGLS